MRLNCTVVVILLSVISVVAAELPEGAPEGVDSNWFGRLQEGIRDGEYHFQFGPASYRPGRGEVFQAPNRALDLRIYFDAEGLEILERSSDGAPTVVHLALAGWGREGAMNTSKAGALREDEGRMERLRGALTETYTNSAAGLELGWEISGSPEGEGPVVLSLELAHASARAQGGGVELISENGRRLVLQAPQVFDREGEVVPAQLLVAERDRLELRVDDGGAAYPLHLKTLLTGTADTTMESDQADAWLGYSVSTAGDVNSDGYADIIVGALWYDNGQIDEGAAFVFLGSASGIVGSTSADAHAMLESDQANAFLGRSVSAAGDVNGDGFVDVIVGADEYDNGQTGEGAAFVFLGSASGIVGSTPADAHATMESDQAYAQMGYSVSTAGDVNGDGYADVIVGAFKYDNGQIEEGAAFVFLGSASGIVGSTPADAHATLESDQTDAWMGHSVSTAGDVNGDGYADIIVGARYYDKGHTNEGAAFVFLGSASGIVGSNPLDAHATLESDQADAWMGHSVSTAGDVNGDGYADIIVGAYKYDNGQTSEGAAFVFLGSASGIVGSNPLDAHATLESDQVDAFLGYSVSTAGDVNSDGYADVIVGADEYDNGQTGEGAAFVFLGSASGIVGSNPLDAHAMLESDQAAAYLGYSVSTAGDINGDGYADIIVGAYRYDNGQSNEGAAFVFLGSALGVVGSNPLEAHATLESDQAFAYLGYSVSTAGDINGDGYADVVVGAYNYDNGHMDEGAAFVFLGSASGLVGSSPLDAHATLESDQAFASLGYSVSTAGDINGDGYADVVVGAYRYDNGQGDEGAAFVFLGSALGVVGSNPLDAHATLESDQANAFLGRSVSAAGDINGDGFADIIVGAPPYGNGHSNEGAAFVFLGSASGLVGSTPSDAHATLESDQAGAWLGNSVSTAGDVNGDGYADIIVGAPYYDKGHTSEGAAFVFLGSASGLVGSSPSDAHATLESDQAYALLGSSVSTAGDINGDGFADIIVGAPPYDNGHLNEGAAFVFLGSASGIVGSSPSDAHATLESDQAYAELGSSVSTAGDINGDGFADIIVGAPPYDNGHLNEGAAFVFLGSASGLVGSSPSDAHATLESDQAHAWLGSSISTAGDVNSDGYADVLVGAHGYDNGHDQEGAAFVFLGNSAGRPVLAQQNDGTPGAAAIQPWGLSTGDSGFGVRMRAFSPRGRELVRLQVEACLNSMPFGFIWCEETTSPGWTDTTASADGVEVEAVFSGLAPGLYRWRARTLYLPLSAGQPGIIEPPNPAHGPWRRLGAQAIEGDIRVPAAVADLAITLDDGQETAVPGETVVYTIVAFNVTGPTASVDATVSDVFPAELLGVTWTCGGSGGGSCATSGTGDINEMVDLPPGGSVTFIASGTVDPGAGGNLVNTALIMPSGRDAGGDRATDPDPSNNLATDVDLLTPEADLGITKDDGTAEAVPGLGLTYTIVASNPGPSSVIGATVGDAFPAELLGISWTCVGADGGVCGASGSTDINDTVDLPAGASVTYTATATVDQAASGTLANTATVETPAGVTERNPADNTATDTDTVVPPIFVDGFESGDTRAWG